MPSGQCNYLPRAMRRRKHQFLVVAAVYVFCSMGMMHHDFPFRMYHTFRGMQAEDSPILIQNNNKHFGIVGSILQKIASVSQRKRIRWEREQLQSEGTTISQWDENPIFVLNLPGSGTQTAFRYFKCALGDTKDIAMYWAKIDEATALQGTTKKNSKHEIGKCFQNNLKMGAPPLEGCGKAKVWASMGYSTIWKGQCFYPSMDPAATEALAKAHPKATILQVIQDPEEWYDSSYSRFRNNLATSCQDTLTSAPIPAENATRADWIAFYKWHETSVRDYATAHPTLQYVQVALNDTNASLALMQQLGLPGLCWQPPKRPTKRSELPREPARKFAPPTQKQEELVAPPQTYLPYPIFVASLPKSGTTSTQRFFQCGLDYDAAGHQWTQNKTTGKGLKIGKCMEYNMQRNRSIFEDCGDFQVWSDTGYIDEPIKQKKNKKKGREEPLGCFFPTIHGGLEAFYQSHPNGTILNVLRDPDQWYNSAMKWRKLPERMSKYCSGFPPPESSASAWRQFYRWHTKQVRDFAKLHPSLTFLELSLEANETGKILQEHTGIPDFCWGDCNPNVNKARCGVLLKMREHKLSQQQEEEQAASKGAGRVSREAKMKARMQKTKETIRKNKPFLNDPRWNDVEKRFRSYKNIPVKAVNGKIPPL